MKKRELEKKLKKAGWWLDRHGGNHDIWTNGKITNQVPRHAEVNSFLLKI
jgi:mRNA interferase HicA